MAEPDKGPNARLDIVVGAEPDPQTRSEAERGPAKAVAIADPGEGGALPRLVASGRGAVAEQMLQIAWANNIKVREDADLAEILSAIDVDSEIPIEAFAAVAEILSYVYRANAGDISFDETEGDSHEHE